LLKKYRVNPEEIGELRYRGLGWPGNASAWEKHTQKVLMNISYEESWGFVQKYRPFRCYLCPDLTAEFADISVGDPWYRKIHGNDHGQSLILIRTERGKKIFHEAVHAGYIKAKTADPEIIYNSQVNLLGKKQAIWGRILAMKLLGIPHPRLSGFYLYENWLDLTHKDKIKSILGTVRRIIQRKYFRPLDYSQYRERI
jgi:coenzyme F420 hydrogenase subunit beta